MIGCIWLGVVGLNLKVIYLRLIHNKEKLTFIGANRLLLLSAALAAVTCTASCKLERYLPVGDDRSPRYNLVDYLGDSLLRNMLRKISWGILVSSNLEMNNTSMAFRKFI